MISTAIVGAGPYGLSLAAHLRARGAPFEIVGRPMESWREHMPVGMMLRSEPFASSLWDPGRRYTFAAFRDQVAGAQHPPGAPLSLNEFLLYADWFRRRAVPDLRDARLVRLSRAADGFELAFDDGDTLRARRVVLATGHQAFRRLPKALVGLPPDLVSHSDGHTSFARFAGRDVTVVGGGQAALEMAALLNEAGAAVRVLVRAPRIAWNGVPSAHPTLLERVRQPSAGLGAGWRSLLVSELPRLFRHLPDRTRLSFVARSWGPAGAWWLRDRVVERLPVLLGHTIERATEHAGRLALEVRTPEGVRAFTTDHVIAATGFAPVVGRLGYLDPGLRDAIDTLAGAPRLSAAFETSVPGLYVLGLASAATFGPVMRFMFGAKHAAPIVARHLASGERRRGASLPIRGKRDLAHGGV